MPAAAERLIFRKMSKVLASISAVGKDRKNSQQGFAYRGIDDIYNELNHRLGEQGIFIVPQIMDHTVTRDIQKNSRGEEKPFFHHLVKMRYSFFAEDGSHVDVETMGESSDFGDKGLGKAQQYAIKVALIQTFVIPTEDEDPDAGGVQHQTAVHTPWNGLKLSLTSAAPLDNSEQKREKFDIRNPAHKDAFVDVCAHHGIARTHREKHNDVFRKLTDRSPEFLLEELGKRISEIL